MNFDYAYLVPSTMTNYMEVRSLSSREKAEIWAAGATYASVGGHWSHGVGMPLVWLAGFCFWHEATSGGGS